jgi:hypothetical protein
MNYAGPFSTAISSLNGPLLCFHTHLPGARDVAGRPECFLEQYNNDRKTLSRENPLQTFFDTRELTTRSGGLRERGYEKIPETGILSNQV